MENSEKRYWAFISYSSKDEAVARRLHRALEHYRMPRDLVGRPMRDGEPTPKRLFPIFRDHDELPLSADLGDAIESALQASRYLIVLCSQSAAASRWVNEEVRFFKSIGGEDRILAIIVSGEPNASDKSGSRDEECFPPALRFGVDLEGQPTNERCEPIAGDLRQGGDGWKACVLKAVAGITGLGLAAFTKREHVRTRRRRILIAGAALLLVGGATTWWDYTRTKVAYYAHLTERFGVPTGVMAVARADLTHRNSTYRVESNRGKVRRVLHVNGSGFPADDDDAPFQAAIRELIYREDGSLQTIDFRSRQGHITAQREFSLPKETTEGSIIIAETKRGNDGAPISIDVGDGVLTESSNKGKSTASVLRSTYRKDGLPFRIEYLNAYRIPTPNSAGISGHFSEYCKGGLLIGTVFMGAHKRAQARRDGVQSIKAVRDERGNEIENTFIAADGKPIMIDGFAKWTSEFDEHGNRIETAYFGTDGKPVLHRDGHARWTAKFDECGNEVERAFLGTDGKPVLLKDGYAKWTAKFDERGNRIEAAFFGTDGKPVLHEYGNAKVTRKFDARGDEIETAYFGTDGQPVLHRDGHARVASTFDERGNIIEQSFFGTDGRPVVGEKGYAKYEAIFDERGNQIEAAFFGTDGQPVLHRDGHARQVVKFDERGNPTEWAFFGTDDQPTLRTDGYAKLEAKFDERGNEIERTYFGADGKPVLFKDGFARWAAKFDERGNQIERAFFGTDGKPVLTKDGFAKWAAKFDERGNPTECAFFGTDGRPVLTKDGFAKWAAKFDERGSEVERTFFGPDGHPVPHSDGYARWVAKYDERGIETEKIYFDTKGQVIKK